MVTIVTRTANGAALSTAQMDTNLTNLNTKVELDDISVTTASASSAGSLSYNNTTGVFTFEPADLSSYLTSETFTSVAQDTTPQLGGNLDVLANEIITSTTNGHLNLSANGTGNIRIGQAMSHQTTDADFNIDANGTGGINLNASVHIEDLLSFAESLESLISVSGTLSINAALGPIKYVVPSGAMTLNGFATPISGQTVTMLIDQATGSSNFTFTLGGGLLTPAGGGVTLTNSGYDLVTVSCLDEDNGLYVVTVINDFQ